MVRFELHLDALLLVITTELLQKLLGTRALVSAVFIVSILIDVLQWWNKFLARSAEISLVLFQSF